MKTPNLEKTRTPANYYNKTKIGVYINVCIKSVSCRHLLIHLFHCNNYFSYCSHLQFCGYFHLYRTRWRNSKNTAIFIPHLLADLITLKVDIAHVGRCVIRNVTDAHVGVFVHCTKLYLHLLGIFLPEDIILHHTDW